MKTPSPFSAALLLSLTSAGFAFDLPGLDKVPANLGLPAVNPARIAGAEIPGSAEAAADKNLETLRAQAAADPDRFIDEHSPADVGLAFGLPANSDEAGAYGIPDSRYVVNNSAAQLAAVRIKVDLDAQRLTVEGPEVNKVFKISSGVPPAHTTPGSGKCFAPDSMETMHYSSLYNNAPMPNAIFFNGNIAIHATETEKLLGQPASHGCVRLSKADAKTLFDIVKAVGKSSASICVEGKTPVR